MNSTRELLMARCDRTHHASAAKWILAILVHCLPRTIQSSTTNPVTSAAIIKVNTARLAGFLEVWPFANSDRAADAGG
jgi:hypothetical protein